MKGGFDVARQEILPAWLAGPDGLALINTLGEDENAAVRELEEVLTFFSPYTCPDDALDLLGQRFALERYPGEIDGTAPNVPGETGSGYRGRLCAAWQAWLWAGTKEAIVGQLRAYGLVDVEVYSAQELSFLPASPIGYDPETSPPWYSAFVVVVGPDFGTTGIGPLLAPFTAGISTTGGSTATRDQVAQIARILLRWKGVHAYPAGVILRFNDTAIGGINTTPPFTPSATPQYAFWRIGKLMGVDVCTAPFVAGGYEF